MIMQKYEENAYKKVDTAIEGSPSEAIYILKKRMEALGIKTSDLSELMQENKSGISRFFNQKMNITAEKTQRLARAMGGVVRLDSANNLYVDTDSLEFEDLIMEMPLTDESSCLYMIAHEIPIAIINLLGINAKDYIIKTNMRKKKTTLFGVKEQVYVASFTYRYYPIIRFGLVISPNIKTLFLSMWVSKDAEALDYKDVAKFRSITGFDKEDTEFLFAYLNSERITLTEEFEHRIIYGKIFDVIESATGFSAQLQSGFSSYVDLLRQLTGNAPPRISYESDSGTDPNDVPTDIIADIIGDREPLCEVDTKHELFEGDDGKPYVDIVPIIPMAEQYVRKYGKELVSKANSAMLCPMCKAKLEHGSQSIKEDILLKLYDKHIDEMKEAGLDVSRTELLMARFGDDVYKKFNFSISG